MRSTQIYNGHWEGLGDTWTDPLTGSSYIVPKGQSVTQKLAKVRAKFADKTQLVCPASIAGLNEENLDLELV